LVFVATKDVKKNQQGLFGSDDERDEVKAAQK